MSYLFWVPALSKAGEPTEHCTRDDFLDTAKHCAKEYFRTWTSTDNLDASIRAAEAAVHAASMLVQAGVVGDRFRALISGHANPVPGSPTGNWATDTCIINLQSVKAGEP